MNKKFLSGVFFIAILITACEKENEPMPLDPDSAEEVMIDRFSSGAGHLFVRTSENDLPGPDEAIDFDNNPLFITKGLGPNGEMSEYYNFDVMSTTPAPIFVLFREGEDSPVEGQLNIISVIPGDAGYNDFWQVIKVTVPSDYIANTVTSLDEINGMNFELTTTDMLVNCPVVPKGSMARKRYLSSESSDLTRGWYKSQVVYYFNFIEKELSAINGFIPTSDIFVCFNINPDMDGGGPPSGFVTEDGMPTGQTHNIPETLPEDAAYSPLWDVNIYNNNNFDAVSDLITARAADIMAKDVAIVNCPIISVH